MPSSLSAALATVMLRRRYNDELEVFNDICIYATVKNAVVEETKRAPHKTQERFIPKQVEQKMKLCDDLSPTNPR